MEPVDRLVVLPQCEQRVAVRPAIVAARGDQPSGPRDDVGHDSGGHEQQERHRTLAGGSIHRPERDARTAPGERIGDDEIDAEPRQRIQARPFHGCGSTESDTRRDDPRTPPDDRPPQIFALVALRIFHNRNRSSAVEEDEEEPEQDEARQDAVEQPDPAHHDTEPVDGEQETGDERCDDRARQLFRDEVHQQHRRGAHQRDHETPRRAVAGAEQPHSQRDDPLAQRRMHHEAPGPGERARIAGHERFVRAVAPGAFVAERPQRPGVFDVVRLIERERLRGGEVRQAQHGCKSRDHQRCQPADDAVPLRIQQQPVAQAPPERQALLRRREQRRGRRHGISLRRAPKLNG